MRTLILFTVLLAVPAIAGSTTIHVPGNYPTIQQAISAAQASDVILVAPGTYTENISFLGKAITVKSAQGPDFTIIDGNQSGSVVTFENWEPPDARLEGFKITNGSGVGGFYGGGICVFSNASPTIVNNIISDNTISNSTGGGGGIYTSYNANPVIEQNVISGNVVKGGGTCYGGGIYCLYSSPTIKENTISGNFTEGQGAGIYVEIGSPSIEGNTISDNTADFWGGGILIYQDCSPSIANNVISGNKVSLNQLGGGGGIAMYKNCSGTIENNLIMQNSAYGAPGIYCEDNAGVTIAGNTIRENHCPTAGGGIFCLNDSPSIIGNTIMLNSADEVGGGIHVTGLSGSSLEVRNNLVMQNTCSQYFGGGITVMASSGVYSDNIIIQNECLNWRGGGLAIINSSGDFTNNLICLNSAGNSGGGVYCSAALSPLLTNNTIFKNSGKNNSGGIRCDAQANLEIVNTIFWGNTSGGSGPQISVMDASTLTISHSDVEGGQPLVFVASNSQMNWGAGMIDADPLFVDSMGGDFHLSYPSPCRNTGYDSIVTEPEDFEGDPRIAYGAVDIGADEFYTHLYWTGNATPGGNVALKFVGLPGTQPVGLCIGAGVLDPPIPSMWGDWYLKFPILGPVALAPIPSNGVEVIAGPLPGTPPAPYSIPMQAVIGDVLTNLCVLEVK